MTTLDPKYGFVVPINTFHVKLGLADDLLAALTKATIETAKHMPGFVSANLHVSLDGKTVVNYAQWRSKAEFEAAMKNPRFQAHMKEASKLVESFDPVLYQLRCSEAKEAKI